MMILDHRTVIIIHDRKIEELMRYARPRRPQRNAAHPGWWDRMMSRATCEWASLRMGLAERLEERRLGHWLLAGNRSSRNLADC
ncbi:MAG TPA: hypothetical protein VLY63_28775 [Anaerolineae bacterium]|nr:hypothetical protein [Anaerolineae bacterium]